MKKNIFFLFAALVLLAGHQVAAKPILIITTDIGQDPDDQQSFIRLLHYADQFELAGIIANADENYKHELPVVKDSILHHLIDAYGAMENNLRIHSPTFPSAAYLHSIVKKGCAGNGNNKPVEDYIGEGKDTEGSDWIIQMVSQTNNEPIHIAVWGGACDLAQALWKVKTTRSEKELLQFVSKLRIYFIGKQDSSNDWIIEHFPDLWLILSLDHGGNNWKSTYRGMFLGGNLPITSKEWIAEHLLGKNPLSSLYPTKTFTGNPTQNPYGAMKEGDSPSFLFFLANGLNYAEKPEWGGWGGRYALEKNHFYRDSPDSLVVSEDRKPEKSGMISVNRWRTDFQADFAARAQWGATADYKNANHYPMVHIVGFANANYIEQAVAPSDAIIFDAGYSFDPDGDSLQFEWFIYPEAGTYSKAHNIELAGNKTPVVRLSVPEESEGKQIHLILKVRDDSTLPLTSYKRIVLSVK